MCIGLYYLSNLTIFYIFFFFLLFLFDKKPPQLTFLHITINHMLINSYTKRFSRPTPQLCIKIPFLLLLHPRYSSISYSNVPPFKTSNTWKQFLPSAVPNVKLYNTNEIIWPIGLHIQCMYLFLTCWLLIGNSRIWIPLHDAVPQLSFYQQAGVICTTNKVDKAA